MEGFIIPKFSRGCVFSSQHYTLESNTSVCFCLCRTFAAATLYTAMSVYSLFVWNEKPVRVTLSYRSKRKHAVLLKSSSQVNTACLTSSFKTDSEARDEHTVLRLWKWVSTSIQYLQLFLADGFLVFKSYNSTLRSDKRYSDGVWHYLSAEGGPTG